MKSSSGDEQHPPPRSWSFVTNHARVFAFLSEQPEARFRDIAEACGVTERTAHQIVTDLEQAGLLERARVGRRNRYALDARLLKLPAVKALTAGQILLLLLEAFDGQPFG